MAETQRPEHAPPGSIAPAPAVPPATQAHPVPPAEPRTVGAALADLSARLFVGRAAELQQFRDWLASDRPEPRILNVSGPGGVGKTELLRAFRRIAEAGGRPVVLVDGSALRPTPAGLLRALGGTSLDEVVQALNADRPLLLIDTAEALGDLTQYLRQELLPRLDIGVRVAIAGRYSLGQAWLRAGAWRTTIQPVPLAGFSADEAQSYLTGRGLTDPTLVAQVRQAAGGYPLALSLAADLTLTRGIRRLAGAPEWRLAVRALVEQLVSDLDAETRGLLEACAIVRQFDQPLLEAIVGRGGEDAVFDRLCRLSVVHAGPHGLALHDDVRRILAEDLRWRHPDRYAQLRLRALAAYRDRMGTAPGPEHEWLVAERLSLWEDAFVQAFLFAPAEPGEVWVEPAGPDAEDEVMGVEMTWHNVIVPTLGTVAYPPGYGADVHETQFRTLVACPGRRLTIARDRDGRGIGFGLALPLYDGAAAVLLDNPMLGPLLRAHLTPAELAALPRRPEDADRHYLVQAAHIGVLPEATHAALFRDILTLLARGGVYYVIAALPAYRSLFDTLGFEEVPGSEVPN